MASQSDASQRFVVLSLYVECSIGCCFRLVSKRRVMIGEQQFEAVKKTACRSRRARDLHRPFCHPDGGGMLTPLGLQVIVAFGKICDRLPISHGDFGRSNKQCELFGHELRRQSLTTQACERGVMAVSCRRCLRTRYGYRHLVPHALYKCEESR